METVRMGNLSPTHPDSRNARTRAFAALAAALLPLAAAATAAVEPQRMFFGFGTSKPDDPAALRQRGADAVCGVRERLAGLGYETSVLLGGDGKVAESGVRTTGRVTCAAVTNALAELRQRLGTNDTVILYSHTHGVKRRGDWPGGMLLDKGAEGSGDRRPGLNWAHYAEQLLSLPARTVVVLTLSCHSGGLVEHLNTDEKSRSQWQARREQGRDFVVLTSQNATALSNPRSIDGETINPFTYAVFRTFESAADGYRRGQAERAPDGKISLAELTEYVIDEAKRHTRANDAANDPDPQVTGSFDPNRILAVLPSASAPPPLPLVEELVSEGERWSCTADAKPLSGLLLKPAGAGPFPAVVLSHGRGGNAQAIMRARGAELVRAGFVCIATDYTHAGQESGRGMSANRKLTQVGACPENVCRGLACIEILRQTKEVDPKRIALYGHSMGAFLTIALAAAAPDQVAAAAITAGGVVPDGVAAAAPTVSVATRVCAPFLILHGTADTTVPPERSELLKRTLDSQGVPNARYLFEGVGHGLPNEKTDEVHRLLREWFAKQAAAAQAR